MAKGGYSEQATNTSAKYNNINQTVMSPATGLDSIDRPWFDICFRLALQLHCSLLSTEEKNRWPENNLQVD